MATLDTSKEPDSDTIIDAQDAEPVAADDNLTEVDAEYVSRPRPRRGLSVFFGLVLGGVLAAGTGFYAARYVVPEGWPFPGVTPEPNPIAVEQLSQGDRLAFLEAEFIKHGEALAGLQADTRAQTIAEAAIADLVIAKEQLAEMGTLVAALDARLTEVEKMPEGSGNEAAEIAAAAYARELLSMREMLAGELARIEAAGLDARVSEEQAETTTRIAAVQAALANVRGALDSGQPFADALKDIHITIPTNLLTVAESGVVTLPDLQQAFPPAARSALDASIQAGIEDGSVGRIAGFFQRQLGTRSLEPQEGDGPDAVLSRAEAALKTGDIAGALQVITMLPEIGRAEMMGWSGLAQQRLDAMTALEALIMQVNGE